MITQQKNEQISRHFTKKNNQMTNKHKEKYIMRYHNTPTKIAKVKTKYPALPRMWSILRPY